MTIDETVKLIEALTKLAGALIWPCVWIFILVHFSSALKEFASNLSELTLKGGGFEASAKRQQAVAALAAASASRAEGGAAGDKATTDARAAVDVVAALATPRAMRRAAGSTVLWVDDRPDNNIFERQALEAMGVRFILATSTEEALAKVRQYAIDAVISDMGRPSDSQAGYTLLSELRNLGHRAPFIVYASSGSAEDRAKAKQRGAVGCTNRPNELFEMVLGSLEGKA